MVDGHGDPNTSPAYAEAIQALYPVAYKLKFASKRDLGRDYVVMPLEGLVVGRGHGLLHGSRDKSRWDWAMMLMVPDWIDQECFRPPSSRPEQRTVPYVSTTSAWSRCPRASACRHCTSGRSTTRPTVLARMHHEFIPDNGLRMVGKHHEIYLSDFRKVAPEKLRTILRQPVLGRTTAATARARE